MSKLYELFNFGTRRPAEPVEGKTAGALTFRRFEPEKDGSMYNRWRRDAWRAAHNTERGYDDVYLSYAAARVWRDADSVWVALFDGKPCGLLELDVKRQIKSGAGWIAFFYLTEEFRGRGFGRLLMQKAEAVYRGRGRQRIALCAAEDNKHALGFYRHLGFVETGSERGALGALLIFEKDID